MPFDVEKWHKEHTSANSTNAWEMPNQDNGGKYNDEICRFCEEKIFCYPFKIDLCILKLAYITIYQLPLHFPQITNICMHKYYWIYHKCNLRFLFSEDIRKHTVDKLKTPVVICRDSKKMSWPNLMFVLYHLIGWYVRNLFFETSFFNLLFIVRNYWSTVWQQAILRSLAVLVFVHLSWI